MNTIKGRIVKGYQNTKKSFLPKFKAYETYTPSRNWVYIIKSDNGIYKIGTTKNIKKRMRNLQSSSPVKLYLLFLCEGSRELERKLHDMFSTKNTHGEWFKLTNKDIDKISSLLGADFC